MQIAAYGFRAEARMQKVGFRKSLSYNLGGLILTGSGISAGGAIDKAIEEQAKREGASEMKQWGQKFYVNLGMSYVDLAMIGANYAPGADPVFFINGPS